MPRRMRLLAVFASLLVMAVSPRAGASPSQSRCFPADPDIQDCWEGRFLEYWEENGGLPVFGYPITPRFVASTRDGTVLGQMAERARLEYHPENTPPYDILLGRLGEDLLVQQGRDWRQEPRGVPQEGCWFAVETRHAVCDQAPGLGFLSFYRSHGLELGDPGVSHRESLALFGLPLTEPQIEINAAGDSVLTQWFERARFEWHPDKPDAYKVLLGLLGRESWGALPRPLESGKPAPPAIGRPAPQAPPSPTAAPEAPAPPARSAPAPAPTPMPVDAGDEALKERIFALVNALHQEAGCPPLARDPLLELAAQQHVDDIAAYKRIDHTGTDGASLRQRLDRVGYPYGRASESIAIYRSADEAVAAWMDEPPSGPHRRNITSCQYTEAGVGLAYDDRGWKWWVMDFASRRPGS